MTLEQKAKEMRNAIDAIELALSGVDSFENLEALWDGVRDELLVNVPMTVASVRQLCTAYTELNRIINSPEYVV